MLPLVQYLCFPQILLFQPQCVIRMLYPYVNVNSFIVKMESFTLELVKLEIRSSFVNMFFRLILSVAENKKKRTTFVADNVWYGIV